MMDDNKAIIEISKAEQALERAADIHEILILRDKTSALALLLNAQGFKEAAQKAKIFQLKAERKAGKWLAENVDHKGGNSATLYQSGTALPEGIGRNESSRWQLEAALPEERFAAWVDDSLANGWEISAGGLRKLATNYLNKHDGERVIRWDDRREIFRGWCSSALTWQDVPQEVVELIERLLKLLEDK